MFLLWVAWFKNKKLGCQTLHIHFLCANYLSNQFFIFCIIDLTEHKKNSIETKQYMCPCGKNVNISVYIKQNRVSKKKQFFIYKIFNIVRIFFINWFFVGAVVIEHFHLFSWVLASKKRIYFIYLYMNMMWMRRAGPSSFLWNWFFTCDIYLQTNVPLRFFKHHHR